MGFGMAVGLRILSRKRVVAGEWVERARALPVANISDVMSRMASGSATLPPMHAAGGIAGPALTVKTRPGEQASEIRQMAAIEAGTLDRSRVDASLSRLGYEMPEV